MGKTQQKKSVPEPEIGVKLIQQLNGLSTAEPKSALNRAIELLDITQTVLADARLFT